MSGRKLLDPTTYMPFWSYIEHDSLNVYRKEDSSEQKLWRKIQVTFVLTGSKLNVHHEMPIFPDLYVRQQATLYRTHTMIAEQPTVVFRTHAKNTEVSYWARPHLCRALIRSSSPSVRVYAHVNSKTSNWFLNKILNLILRKTVEYFTLYLYQSTLIPTLDGVYACVYARTYSVTHTNICPKKSVFNERVEKNLLYFQRISL